MKLFTIFALLATSALAIPAAEPVPAAEAIPADGWVPATPEQRAAIEALQSRNLEARQATCGCIGNSWCCTFSCRPNAC